MPVVRVPGIAVYLFEDAGAAPPALLANLRHNKVLHEMVLLVSVEVGEVPHVAVRKILRYTHVARGIVQVRLRFGFMDDPDVPAALRRINIPGFTFRPDEVTYVIGSETVTPSEIEGMLQARERLFALMNRSAANASRFFHLPPRQVLEVGTQVEI